MAKKKVVEGEIVNKGTHKKSSTNHFEQNKILSVILIICAVIALAFLAKVAVGILAYILKDVIVVIAAVFIGSVFRSMFGKSGK